MKLFVALNILMIFLLAPQAEAKSFAPRTVGFHVGVMDPYPSPIGFGLSYFFQEFIGITGMAGIKSMSESKLSTFTGGLKFMATREKISPTAFLGISSYETESGAKATIGYVGVGINLSISDNVYIGGGGNFGLTQREGKNEVLPYFQFGVLY